ncbi:tol-pal system protein YbgF [secondary endosymbiont of Ctenarytaina eucalypti]|uniref:Cell division coordinator CpoB n=1 Tax=secondary endosymbiont of Ctenarytaina eucalypti TaxID=1199245 RepID=J3YS75_9ENTR|nr:tol-pal system protein YbgF [secondary endosymbiont of Ctenarytaina eucalypti]AFP85023.1 tol-pal system protein YbgF [secondary endosymbiont of Ctenarytaina eucalypti]
MRNYFRFYLLSLSLLIGVSTPLAATIQAPISTVCSSAVEDWVTYIDRIAIAHSQLLTQIQDQLVANQHEIDSLRGQLQENQHQLSLVIERQQQIYQNMDSPYSKSPPASKKNEAKTSKTASSNDEAIDYNEAVALVLQKKQYAQAISRFQNFVKSYPNSIYQPNAYYWLGKLNVKQGKKENAIYYFALVAKTYPKFSKAPSSLLKVGMLMQEKGQKDNARAVFQQVGKLYPSSASAKQAQKQILKL